MYLYAVLLCNHATEFSVNSKYTSYVVPTRSRRRFRGEMDGQSSLSRPPCLTCSRMQLGIKAEGRVEDIARPDLRWHWQAPPQ